MGDKFELHSKSDSYCDLLILKEFINLQKDQNEDILEYVNRRDDLYKKVQTAGFNFENKVLMGLMLIGLPLEYECLWRVIQIHDDSLTRDRLEIRLSEEEKRLQNSDTSSNAVFYTEFPLNMKMYTKSNECQFDSNSYSHIKIEEEEIEVKIENLHHSVEIKEETSIVEVQPDRESKPKASAKPFACKICGNKWARKSDLKRHLRTHSGEKPFTCEICDFKFTRQGQLKIHLSAHSGEKPFGCEMCDYKSTRKEHLNIHIRTHTGEKPFACPICDLKYASKDVLHRHIRTHTDKKPFTCKICDYKCVRKDHLNRHLRAHTSENPHDGKINLNININ